jgi:hypothetical protein
MESTSFPCFRSLTYPRLREIRPERVTILVIILVVFLTSYGVAAAVAVAFALALYTPARRTMITQRPARSAAEAAEQHGAP